VQKYEQKEDYANYDDYQVQQQNRMRSTVERERVPERYTVVKFEPSLFVRPLFKNEQLQARVLSMLNQFVVTRNTELFVGNSTDLIQAVLRTRSHDLFSPNRGQQPKQQEAMEQEAFKWHNLANIEGPMLRRPHLMGAYENTQDAVVALAIDLMYHPENGAVVNLYDREMISGFTSAKAMCRKELGMRLIEASEQSSFSTALDMDEPSGRPVPYANFASWHSDPTDFIDASVRMLCRDPLRNWHSLVDHVNRATSPTGAQQYGPAALEYLVQVARNCDAFAASILREFQQMQVGEAAYTMLTFTVLRLSGHVNMVRFEKTGAGTMSCFVYEPHGHVRPYVGPDDAVGYAHAYWYGMARVFMSLVASRASRRGGLRLSVLNTYCPLLQANLPLCGMYSIYWAVTDHVLSLWGYTFDERKAIMENACASSSSDSDMVSRARRANVRMAKQTRTHAQALSTMVTLQVAIHATSATSPTQSTTEVRLNLPCLFDMVLMILSASQYR
jgi:hypothetical protein